MTLFCSLPYLYITPTTISVWLVPYSNPITILSSLGRVTAIHLRIGHPYISSADVRSSNGFESLAYSKDAAVVVPVVAAVGHTPSSSGAPMPAVRYDLNGGLPMLIRFIIYQKYMVIVYWCVSVNLIWHLYLFWLSKHFLSLSLNLSLICDRCAPSISDGITIDATYRKLFT